MNFENIFLQDLPKDEVVLGYNKFGNLMINLKADPSIIITGETGSGKSILLDQILLQQIKKLTSMELGIIAIDTSGVELNYYVDTNYALFSAINDIDKSIVALSRVLKEIDRRKTLLINTGVTTVDEYNEVSDSKLPFIIVAIDDDRLLLRNKDVDKMLSGIISQLYGLNIALVLVTSDVHNKFFEQDKNILASIRISFDYTNSEEAHKVNINGADNLSIGKFIMKRGNSTFEYNNFEFDDSLINKVLSNL